MPDLMKFEFDSMPVRLIERDGDPWFVAADVCKVLEISNPRDAISKLDADEKGVANTDTLGGAQQINVISEPGLYELVMRSRKPEAKKFSRWVRHTVLPAIRKDGGYIAGEEKVATGEMDDDALMAKALQVAANKLERIARERDTALEAVRAAQPKVAFHDSVRDAVNCVSVGEFAKEINAGEIRFFGWLRDRGYLLSSTAHWNHPAQRYVDSGIFKLIAGRPYRTPGGEMIQGQPRTVITGKGQIYLAEKWRAEQPQGDLMLTGEQR